MASKYTELIVKTNGSKALDLKIEACKSDGVTLSTVELFTAEIGNKSQITTWDYTATQILEAKNTLNAAATDKVWIRIAISGGGTQKLTTADTVQFQFAHRGVDNVYSRSNEDMMGITAVILGIVFIILGVIATPFINLDGTGKAQTAYSKATRGKGRKRKKASRGTMGLLPVIFLGLAAVVMGFLTMDAAALPVDGTTAQAATGGIDPLFVGLAGSFILIGGWAFMMFSGFTRTMPKKFSIAGFTITSGVGILGSALAMVSDTATFVSSAYLGNLGWQGWIFAGGYTFFAIILVWNGIWCWRQKKPFTLWR
jgi:hypothetical protein